MKAKDLGEKQYDEWSKNINENIKGMILVDGYGRVSCRSRTDRLTTLKLLKEAVSVYNRMVIEDKLKQMSNK